MAQSYLAARSDVANLAECKNVVKKIVEHWERLDVVVHNAIYMPLITAIVGAIMDWTGGHAADAGRQAERERSDQK